MTPERLLEIRRLVAEAVSTYNEDLETFWDEEKQHSEFRWGERVLIGSPGDVARVLGDVCALREDVASLRRSLKCISEGVRETVDLELARHGVRR